MNNKEKAEKFINISTELSQSGYFNVFVEYSQPDNRVLSELFAAKTKLSPSDLSDRLLLSRVTVTNCLNVLENDRLIIRTISKTDRRKVNVNLTEKGKMAVIELMKKAIGFIEQMFSSLGEEKVNSLFEIIETVKKHII